MRFWKQRRLAFHNIRSAHAKSAVEARADIIRVRRQVSF